MYFCETENFAYGEINERSFSNPHTCTSMYDMPLYMLLTHWGLVTSYGDIDLGQHWLR